MGEDALIKVQDIADHINDRQKEIENMSQCLQIQNKLRGLAAFKKNLVEPHRKFINQFAFNKKKDKKLKLHQLCVFSDAIVITNEKWKVKAFLSMQNIHLKIINNKDFGGKGFILKHAMEELVYFDTNETMDDDVEELDAIIKEAKELLTHGVKSPLFIHKELDCNAYKMKMKKKGRTC